VPGEIPSLYQNSHSAIRPSQNTGADTKNRANSIDARSIREPRLIAETMPMGMPMHSQTRAAPTASEMVTQIRSKSRSFTGERVTKENPSPGQPYSSPVKMFFRNSTYCCQTGLSRPNWRRTSAICSGVGFLPANWTAGSVGGITKKMTKVKAVMTRTTRTTHRSRRTI
jgi:hypothetical protein